MQQSKSATRKSVTQRTNGKKRSMKKCNTNKKLNVKEIAKYKTSAI